MAMQKNVIFKQTEDKEVGKAFFLDYFYFTNVLKVGRIVFYRNHSLSRRASTPFK